MKKPIKNLERIIWVSLTIALAGALTLPHAQNKAFISPSLIPRSCSPRTRKAKRPPHCVKVRKPN